MNTCLVHKGSSFLRHFARSLHVFSICDIWLLEKTNIIKTISKNQYYSSYCYYSCFFRFRPIRFELLKKRIFRRKYVRKYSTDDRTLTTPNLFKRNLNMMC